MKLILLVYFFSLMLGGCAIMPTDERISLLRRLGADRKQTQIYLDKQENLFYKLKNDIDNNRLKKETPKEEILAIYGEPILCKTIEEKKESCLYRHPTRYFSSDLIYLYFDEEKKLYSWQVQHKCNQKLNDNFFDV